MLVNKIISDIDKTNNIENTILLSDTCKSSSVPILLCGEEDVEGSHAVSTGKIKDENLEFNLK